jgi:MoaA/NifB/PqqE/SkfB family radical SAM enzyme
MPIRCSRPETHLVEGGVLQRLLYSPFLAQLVVTRRCNLACGYCNEYDDYSPAVPREVLERRIDRLSELGAFSIEFTGGEPLLHPDLPELIGYAKRGRFVRIMMISNGFLLNEDKVRALNDAGLNHLQVSVDGVAPNDITMKTLKPLRAKLEVLAKTARFAVTLSGVIGASESEDVMEVVQFAKDHGFKPRVLLIHGGDGQLELNEQKRSLYRRVRNAIGGRFDEAHDYRVKLLSGETAPFKCRAGSRYLYVDEFGLVHWCSQQRDRFAVPLEEYTHDLLKTQFYTRKGCEDHCTVGCARTNSAVDEWRSQGLEPEPPPLVALTHT